MREFFKKLFAPTRKTGNSGRAVRPMLESLEGRDLPNAGPWLEAAHLFGRGGASEVRAAFAGATGGSSDAGSACEAGHQTQTLTASLTGASGASGSVTFRSNTASGDNHLSVQVSGLTASTTYTVSSGSTTLGTITTDANGKGKLSVSDLSPALTAGATITVTDPSSATVLSGTLATPTAPTNTNLIATLGGTAGGDGFAFFHANSATGNNRLRLFLFGLTASSTYTVQLGGSTIGTVTTDANGRGQLSLSNLSTPPAAGSVLTVLDSTGATVLQGSFAASDFGFGLFGGRHHH
jgi:hypothetical protein